MPPIMRTAPLAVLLVLCLALTACGPSTYTIDPNAPVTGQLHWRGINQNGTSDQTGLPTSASLEGDDANLRWTLDVPGRGTAAIAEYHDGPRLFALGYPGEGANLTETLYCLNPETGEQYWSRSYADFISDIVYNRYTIGGPTVDPETGNVFIQTSQGLIVALDRDGNELWQVSLMEQFGKLTFPNGRTGVITIDGDLAIVNCISTNWGSEGPARNRFYAFDKNTGQLVWSSTPGVGPPFLKDSSFSTPHIENRRGYRVFYAGTGCGNLVCVNVRTGKPLWRYQMSMGGVNASPLIYDNGTPDFPSDDLIIQVHGKENVGDSGRGYMIAIRADQALTAAIGSNEQLQLDSAYVAWRNDDVSMFTSSPTIVDGVVYQCTIDGQLVAIDAKTGETLWELGTLGASQLHASPMYADGRLYIPYWNDGLYILEPGREKPTNIQHTKLEGKCIATTAGWDGKLYIHTTEMLYCFGNKSGGRLVEMKSDQSHPISVTPTKLMLKPAEFLLRPGESVTPAPTAIDRFGKQTPAQDHSKVLLESWIPPTAKVKVRLNAELQGGAIVATQSNTPSAGAYLARGENVSGTARGRVLPVPPYDFDFDKFKLNETDKTDNVPYAHPPLPWIGARMKWQVRDDPTDPKNKVLAKTLDRVLFQRSMIFMGHPDDTGYTVQADVMSDGNRRGGSVVGVICQRYLIVLDANKNVIEISSNPNRLQVSEPFKFTAKTWYTIKAKVMPDKAGNTGTVLGKAWPRGEDEPEDWSITVKVPNVHMQGSPGIYGFSPQSRHRVYVDNVKVEPNE